MSVSSNFDKAQEIMLNYPKELAKERDPKWKQTISKVLSVALFSLGMLAILTSSVVGLPGWMIVTAFTGWVITVMITAIWHRQIVQKENKINNSIEICKQFETGGETPKYQKAIEDQLKNWTHFQSDPKKIIHFCDGVIALCDIKEEYEKNAQHIQNQLNDFCKPE
jgi:hypothetical protein